MSERPSFPSAPPPPPYIPPGQETEHTTSSYSPRAVAHQRNNYQYHYQHHHQQHTPIYQTPRQAYPPPPPPPVISSPHQHAQNYSQPTYHTSASSSAIYSTTPITAPHAYPPPPPVPPHVPVNYSPLPQSLITTQSPPVQGTPSYTSQPVYHSVPQTQTTISLASSYPAPPHPATSTISVQTATHLHTDSSQQQAYYQTRPRPPIDTGSTAGGGIEDRAKHYAHFAPVPRTTVVRSSAPSTTTQDDVYYSPLPRPPVNTGITAGEGIEDRKKYYSDFAPVPRPTVVTPSVVTTSTTVSQDQVYYAPAPPPPPPPSDPSTYGPGRLTTDSSNGLNHDYYNPSDGPPQPKSEPSLIDKLSQGLGRLALRSDGSLVLQDDEPNPSSTAYTSPTNNNRKSSNPRSLIVATGTPRDVVAHCPKSYKVQHSLYWYHLQNHPDYLICTRCHANHIQNTPLDKPNFIRVQRPQGQISTCSFWLPRVKDVLWPQALESNNISNVRDFINSRVGLPACKGLGGQVTGADGFQWFGMVGNDINGFISCEACYQDNIVGSSFESYFSPYKQQSGTDKWTCDLAVPYINRAFNILSKTRNWSEFISSSSKRFNLPPCQGLPIQLNACNWYVAPKKVKDMHVCEACYLDRIALTPLENGFQPDVPDTSFDAWMNNLGKTWKCDISSINIATVFAIDTAVVLSDPSVFWSAAKTIIPLVPCTKNGIVRGKWWTLVGGCDGLNICETCHAGILQSTDTARFFQPANTTQDPEAAIICTFCPDAPRFKQFAIKFAEAVDRGVFSYYSDEVRKFASVTPCPGVGYLVGAKWWGYPEALFCEDCYVGYVSETWLGDKNMLPLKGEFDARPMCCSIWSPRMRGKWEEVCSTAEREEATNSTTRGDDEAAATKTLSSFLDFAEHRMKVYGETRPEIIRIEAMREMAMMNAMSLGMMGVMMQGANGIASVSGATDGYLHGNSGSLGWHETEYGVASAQAFGGMQAGMASANSMSDWMVLVRLKAAWAEVE